MLIFNIALHLLAVLIKHKAKFWLTRYGSRRNTGTPVLLDVLNHQISSKKVTEIRRLGSNACLRDMLYSPLGYRIQGFFAREEAPQILYHKVTHHPTSVDGWTGYMLASWFIKLRH